ncbi:MAG: hypothetical protein OEW16_00525 [Gammaproteobacteria bacterium]|nr:hypothetical protein [Gammaproteobacteria bacterium]
MRIILLLGLLLGSASIASAADANPVEAAETTFLDFLDAANAVGAIDSGLFAEYQGRGRAIWDQLQRNWQPALTEQLAAIDPAAQSPADRAAIAAMRVTLADFEDPSAATSGTPEAPRCADAPRTDLDYAALRAALVGCFREFGNALRFEDGLVDRGTALQLLHDIPEPERRKALFDAFRPMWSALNGNNEPGSPYSRMIRMAAADAAENGSQVDAAARAIGVSTAEVEKWLLQILEAWRQANGPAMVEPWDYRHSIGEANRMLAAKIPATELVPLNERFYLDLGSDLEKLGVVYDLGERADKSPLAYTDFLKRGREIDGEWHPTIARVVGRYPLGGLFSLNELVHENGHAVHISAIKNRPAFTDWPDTIFTEAFADVPSWSVYEPAWQKKYLGTALPEALTLRALYGTVVLDVAWSLFEIRMLREPAGDPNAVWTDITSRYLRIKPHPELPWWAMRVQLASRPGYMVNYGLGAVLTAEIRAETRSAIGDFDAGNAAWYGWNTDQLLRYGSEHSAKVLMLALLGRAPSPEAVLAQIRRIHGVLDPAAT